MVKLNHEADTMYEVFGLTETQHENLQAQIEAMLETIEEGESESMVLERFLNLSHSKKEERFLIYQAGILNQLFRQFEDMAEAAKNN